MLGFVSWALIQLDLLAALKAHALLKCKKSLRVNNAMLPFYVIVPTMLVAFRSPKECVIHAPFAEQKGTMFCPSRIQS